MPGSNDRGVISNTDCDNVDHPADGDCFEWWLYSNGYRWYEDDTIRLICKGLFHREKITSSVCDTNLNPNLIN